MQRHAETATPYGNDSESDRGSEEVMTEFVVENFNFQISNLKSQKSFRSNSLYPAVYCVLVLMFVSYFPPRSFPRVVEIELRVLAAEYCKGIVLGDARGHITTRKAEFDSGGKFYRSEV